MTLLADLLAARARIDRPEKWCKGELQKGHRYCAVGAVYVAPETSRYRRIAAYNALERLVPNRLPSNCYNLGGYNDDPSTTHADIMDLYDRAIANERYAMCLRGLA